MASEPLFEIKAVDYGRPRLSAPDCILVPWSPLTFTLDLLETSMKAGSLNIFSTTLFSALLVVLCLSSIALQAFAQPNQQLEHNPLQGTNACRVAATASAMRSALWPAMLGEEKAFGILMDERASLLRLTGTFSNRSPLLSSIQRDAEMFLAQKDVVLKAHQATRSLRKQSVTALEAAENVFIGELMDRAEANRLSAASSLAMLTQRLGKSAAEVITTDGIDPEAIFLLGKDTRSFEDLLAGMVNGSTQLRIGPAKTPKAKQRLAVLEKTRSSMKEQADAILSNLKNLVTAREAQASLIQELAALADLSANACSSAEKRNAKSSEV